MTEYDIKLVDDFMDFVNSPGNEENYILIEILRLIRRLDKSSPITYCKNCVHKKSWTIDFLDGSICAYSGLRYLTEDSFCHCGQVEDKKSHILNKLKDKDTLAVDAQGNKIDYAVFDDETTMSVDTYNGIKSLMDENSIDFQTAKNYFKKRGSL